VPELKREHLDQNKIYFLAYDFYFSGYSDDNTYVNAASDINDRKFECNGKTSVLKFYPTEPMIQQSIPQNYIE
jgi:hypothetical protein